MNRPLTTFRTPQGEELVVITRAEYDRLVAGLGPEGVEDVGVAYVVDATSAVIARGEDVAIPETVWEAIEGGAHPIAAVRGWRGLTQAQLAESAGTSQAHVSQIEAGRKQPSVEVLTSVARVLRVPTDLLLGLDGAG